MPMCVVPNCRNRNDKGFRVFSLPQGDRNAERRNTWIRNINRKDLPSASFVCEVHFEQNQFENNRQDGRRFLRQDAIPTLFNQDVKTLHESETRFKYESVSSDRTRRSSRKRKTIKFEEFLSEDEESAEESVLKIKQEQTNLTKLSYNDVRCRACLSILKKSNGHILKKLLLGKTIKHAILRFVPELSCSLSENDYICNKCYRLLVNFLNFISSIIDTDAKIKSGKISLEVFQHANQEDNLDISTANKTHNDVAQDVLSFPKKVERQRKQDLAISQRDENLIFEKIQAQETSAVVPQKCGRKRKISAEGNIDEEKYDKSDQNEAKKYSEKSDNQHEDTSCVQKKSDRSINTVESNLTNKDKLEEPIQTDESEVRIFIDHDYIPDEEVESETFRCPVCQTDYRTIRGIKYHLIKQHGIKEELHFECAICDIKFIRFKDMLKHKSNHGFPCNECKEIFPNENELTSHKNNHPEAYSCERCGQQFEKPENVTKHSLLHDLMTHIKSIVLKRESLKQSQNYFKCEYCNVTFRQKRVLQDHIKMVHLKIKDIQCTVCTKKFSTKALMKHHCKTVHSKEKPYKCDECDSMFKRKIYLENHKMTHKSIISPSLKTYSRLSKTTATEYQCPFCPTTEHTKQSLITHLSVHSQERKFVCKYCELKLSSRRTKYVHERTHESDPKSKFVCLLCWKRFPSEELLQTHNLTHLHHNFKRYSCCLCGAMFARKIILENHILDVHMRNDDNINSKPAPSSEALEDNVKTIEAEWETDEELDEDNTAVNACYDEVELNIEQGKAIEQNKENEDNTEDTIEQSDEIENLSEEMMEQNKNRDHIEKGIEYNEEKEISIEIAVEPNEENDGENEYGADIVTSTNSNDPDIIMKAE